MAATVEIDEQNGPDASPTLTHNIANTNMGSADIANLDPAKFPIAPKENTREKWQLLHVTNMSTSTRITKIKVWRTGGLGADAIHLTNASSTNYAGAATYSTPTTAISTVANQTMPTSVPDPANLGIGGSLTGFIATPGYSDFLAHQIQTGANALSGSSSTMNYQYDEFS